MKLKELFTGRLDFKSKSEIIEFVRNSKNFDPEGENLEQAVALLFFITSKQYTWFVATKKRLYCILDDIRKDAPHINWSMSRQALVAGDKVVVNVSSREKSEFTGLLDIGDEHRGWLYTKRLFSKEPVENRFRKFIAGAMIAESETKAH